MDPGLWTLEVEVQRVESGGGDSEGAKKRGRAGLSYPYLPLYPAIKWVMGWGTAFCSEGGVVSEYRRGGA